MPAASPSSVFSTARPVSTAEEAHPGVHVASSVRSAPKYMPYGDAARVLGTVAVVLSHVCDMILFDPELRAARPLDWWICNLVDATGRWAVPVYIMLSGALLLDPARAEAPVQFYRKRLARLGLPIIFWSAFFMWLSIYYTKWVTPAQAWQDLLLGKPYPHLHFMFRIFGLYAFTPMLRVFLQHASRGLVTLTTVLCLGLGVLNSALDAYTGAEQSAFIRFVPFLGFYLLGYLLREARLTRRQIKACWLLAAACALLLAGGTGLLTNLFGLRGYPSLGFMLYDFLSPLRVVMGLCAWLILVNAFDEKWLASRAGRFTSRWLAPATLGIYLCHPFFREVLTVNGVNALWHGVWIGIPVVTVLVYVPSVVFTIGVMRIPWLRRIMG